MLSIIIGILMSLGVINTGVEFNNLDLNQKQALVNAWVGDPQVLNAWVDETGEGM